MSILHCWNCEELIEDAHPKQKFCSPKCRSAYNRLAMSGAGVDNMADARKIAKKLAFESMADEVREVLREEIRKDIQQHVRDNVAGAAEAMTHMLPKVITSLAIDLDDPDPIFRQRAAKLVLQYTMPLGDKGDDGDDGHVINIFHGVPVPETNLGDRMKTFIEQAEEVVDPDPEWVECGTCHQEKHPDAGHFNSGGFICRACMMKQKMRRADGGFMLEDRLPSG